MAGLVRRAILPAGLAVIVLVAAGTVASAYWSGSGTGPGSASTQTVGAAVTLSPGTPTASLFPGGRGAVVLTLSNPNPADIHIGELLLDTTQGALGFAVDASHASCPTSSYSFTDADNDGAGWTVPARLGGVDGSLAVTLADAVAMSAAASNACQGAAVTVYLAAGP